jgi:hypothetical protein
MTTQDRITLGMCINNATAMIAARPENEVSNNETLVQEVYDLADALLAEYQNRYDI